MAGWCLLIAVVLFVLDMFVQWAPLGVAAFVFVGITVLALFAPRRPPLSPQERKTLDDLRQRQWLDGIGADPPGKH